MLKYAYFPGCSMESTGTTYRLSIDYVCRKIGLELKEIPDWNCCGATSGHTMGKWLSLSLPYRNIALSERYLPGLDICVPCASCYSRMLFTTNEIRKNEEARAKLQEITGMKAEGSGGILSLVDILLSEEAQEAVKKAIVRPLVGFKPACYYGCLTTRPASLTGAKDIESPKAMEELLKLAGVECVDWDFKTECCGGSHQVDAPKAARPAVERIFRNAKANGAEAIITACPMCHLNLDMREEEINKTFGTAYDLPVYQFTQILAVAMGANAAQVGLAKHFYPAYDRMNRAVREAVIR